MQTTLDLEIDQTKAAGVLDAPATASKSTKSKPKYNTKKASMLRLFINLGERGINCFESANSHHDYVLRTTVSDLQIDYGLEFSRKWEQVPNAFGSKTDCMRYWLDDVNKAKALAILGNEGAI
jgi:hypothetical protein